MPWPPWCHQYHMFQFVGAFPKIISVWIIIRDFMDWLRMKFVWRVCWNWKVGNYAGISKLPILNKILKWLFNFFPIILYHLWWFQDPLQSNTHHNDITVVDCVYPVNMVQLSQCCLCMDRHCWPILGLYCIAFQYCIGSVQNTVHKLTRMIKLSFVFHQKVISCFPSLKSEEWLHSHIFFSYVQNSLC